MTLLQKMSSTLFGTKLSMKILVMNRFIKHHRMKFNSKLALNWMTGGGTCLCRCYASTKIDKIWFALKPVEGAGKNLDVTDELFPSCFGVLLIHHKAQQKIVRTRNVPFSSLRDRIFFHLRVLMRKQNMKSMMKVV